MCAFASHPDLRYQNIQKHPVDFFGDFDRYEKVLETEIDLTFPTANTSTLPTAVMLR